MTQKKEETKWYEYVFVIALIFSCAIGLAAFGQYMENNYGKSAVTKEGK